MRIFFDTEFYEDGKTIDLMSIAMVREDGAELYLVNSECDWRRPLNDCWHRENTITHLPSIGSKAWVTKSQIADRIVEFAGESPEFWAYYSDYDWVVLCQLFGRMIDLPLGWPMFCHDLKQLLDEKGIVAEQHEHEHDALEDARWVSRAYLMCIGSTGEE